ncbi:MAG TPA: glycosyltransferase family 39 protein [bacterium]|nr:glycosyltransferase family 39 protein [bacterium]HPP29743.1 glycosyltransferase family 39 protein [bacterium]
MPKKQQKLVKKNYKPKILLGIILFVGFILRCIYLYYFKDTPYFNPFLMDGHDQKTFILWAQQILKHPWYVNGEPFYMAPLYAYFLAFSHLITGGNLLLIAMIQLTIDVLLCFLIYYTGKILYNEWAGIIAAGLSIFYRTSIVYAATVLSDSLIYFLYILFIMLVYYSLQKPNFIRWVITGILLGLSALAKPTIAIFLPFFLVGLYVYPEKKFLPVDIKEKFQPLVIFFIVLIISGMVILPITVRNYYVSGKFIPICTNGPVNWRIGNSTDSIGLFHYPEGKLLSPSSLAFWKLFFRKMGFFFTSYEWPQNLNVHLMEKVIPVLKIAFVKFGFIIPAGLTGLFVLFRNWKKNFIFITFTISNVLWVVLFFITDRYRLPAVGCFSVCAGSLIVWCIEKLKAKKLLQPVIVLVIASTFAFFFNTKPGPLVPEVSYRVFANLSIKNIQYDIQQNNLQKAHKEALTYYRILPGDFRASFLLANTFFLQGERETAIGLLKQTLELNPQFTPARDMLNSIF